MNTENTSNADGEAKRSALQKLAEGQEPDATNRIKVAEKLRPLVPDLLVLRKRFRLETLAKMLGEPSIAIKVAPSTLGRLLTTSRRKSRGRSAAV